MVNSAPGASVTGPDANRPSRIFGPCRSTSTATPRPLASPALRTLRYEAWWLAWSPWLMLSRATSSPAATSAATWPGPDVAGPRVQTIFARRPISAPMVYTIIGPHGYRDQGRGREHSRAGWIRWG